MSKIARRDFLKVAPAAAGMVASAKAFDGVAAGREGAGGAAAVMKIGTASYTPAEDYPIRPKRHWDVKLSDTFWKPKVVTNAEVTIPFELQKISEASRAFNVNVLEAAISCLKTHPDPHLQQMVDAHVQQLKQMPPRGNGGFEVAVTYYNTTGNRNLLDQAIETADALYNDFVMRNAPFSGGERDAINCAQLYRATHDKKHLDLAKHYLDIRGLENSVNRSRHNQSYKPVLEQSEAVGHAVNCVSLIVSLVDVGTLTGIADYFKTAERMWSDVVSRKLYITGGVGATGNEGFGEPYSLPNVNAYSETCAVLMFITLNHRMFMATGDAKYIDVMERGMYNNAIDGVSVSGNRFFYVNRLASAGDGRDTRWERASLECCPPNLVRFLASMPGYVYAQDTRGAIYINLYVSSDAAFTVGGKDLELSVLSEMPWGGKSRITVAAKAAVRGTIKVRIPGWARNQPAPGSLYAYADRLAQQATVVVKGESVSAVPDAKGYVSIERTWSNGDVIEVDFPMTTRRITADRRVVQNRRRIAVERGPIVYCVEAPDVEGGRVLDLLFDPAVELKPKFEQAFYGGAMVIETEARRISKPTEVAKRTRLIPYYLWANRGAGEMTVWLSTAGYAIGDTGPAGGYIFYENPNYLADGWRYLEAAPFDQSAGTKWGCFRREIPGARGTAVGSGQQNTLDILTACTDRENAADLCANLTVNGVRGWFLPSRDELALLYRNLKAASIGDFRDAGVQDNFTYWASTQNTADMAAHIDFADLGRQHSDDKDFPRRVRAIRAF
jgi:DUF1680 family protein